MALRLGVHSAPVSGQRASEPRGWCPLWCCGQESGFFALAVPTNVSRCLRESSSAAMRRSRARPRRDSGPSWAGAWGGARRQSAPSQAAVAGLSSAGMIGSPGADTCWESASPLRADVGGGVFPVFALVGSGRLPGLGVWRGCSNIKARSLACGVMWNAKPVVCAGFYLFGRGRVWRFFAPAGIAATSGAPRERFRRWSARRATLLIASWPECAQWYCHGVGVGGVSIVVLWMGEPCVRLWCCAGAACSSGWVTFGGVWVRPSSCWIALDRFPIWGQCGLDVLSSAWFLLGPRSFAREWFVGVSCADSSGFGCGRLRGLFASVCHFVLWVCSRCCFSFSLFGCVFRLGAFLGVVWRVVAWVTLSSVIGFLGQVVRCFGACSGGRV